MKLLLNAIIFHLTEIFRECEIFFRHFFAVLKIKLSPQKPTKLHLGCGNISKKGYANIDIVPSPAVDSLLDLRRRLPYQKESVNFIFSEHVIEHFFPYELIFLFSECHKVLKKKGELSFSIPDFQSLSEQLLFKKTPQSGKFYKNDLLRFGVSFKHLSPLLENVYYYNNLIHQCGEHKFFYTFPVLQDLLRQVGFTQITLRKWCADFDSHERKGHSIFIKAIK